MDFFERLKIDNKINLTEEQYEAVIKTEGNNLLLACPGSGKTTVMVVKTAYLISEKGLDPKRLLTVTFSRASARDMQKRYEKLFGDTHPAVKFSTIHSFCYQIMQHHFRTKGLQKENIEGDNSKGTTKTKLITHLYERQFGNKPTEDVVEEISSAISYFKNLMVPPSDFGQFSLGIRGIKEIYIAYEAFNLEHQLYDYDDMLLISYHTLLADTALLTRLQRQYDYIQVDEAQDNSKLQNEIIKLLVTPTNNLFMVADDDQTIYEWRGSDPEGVLKFQNHYNYSQIYRMEQNFRSSQDIVSLSNQFIKSNLNRYDKNLMTRNPSYQPIEIVKLGLFEDQSDYLIKALRSKKGALSKYAVLFRNNLSVIPLAHRLEQEGIDFGTKGYSGYFFTHWVVTDIKDFLMFALQPDRTDLLDRIYYKNDAFISKKIFEMAKGNVGSKVGIFDAIHGASELKSFQKKKIIHLKHQFKNLAGKPIGHAIDHIENELGYSGWLANSAGRLGVSFEGAKNILAILKYITKGCKDFYDFINRLDTLQKILGASVNNLNPNALVLSTLHSSKGLEFDAVFMIDLVKGIFPSDEALNSKKLLEAERRLFYVGMTRARYNLYLLSGNERTLNPSIFVKEVDKLLHPEKYEVQSLKEADRLYKLKKPEKKPKKITHPASYVRHDRVKHRTYGDGVVVDVLETCIIIEFKDGLSKRFGLDFVLQNGLIEKG